MLEIEHIEMTSQITSETSNFQEICCKMFVCFTAFRLNKKMISLKYDLFLLFELLT